MQIRLATIKEYDDLHRIRMSVRENALLNPAAVTFEHYREMLESRGRGWVCEIDGRPVGFAIGDLKDSNIWALFVEAGHEGRGVGRALHDVMVAWLFSQGATRLWLSTDPNTRAERFYQRAGWRCTGLTESGEARYELNACSV